MKKITLQKVCDCLENDLNEVVVDSETERKALIPLNRMLELAK